MLNNLLTQYLVSKLIDENHPTIEYDRCINEKQKKKLCTVCEKACHREVLQVENLRRINWYECVDCNICVSACPSRAISSSASNMNKILSVCDTKEKEIILNCKREENYSDVKLHYIASYPWEILAYLALGKPVIIMKRSCENCIDCNEEVIKTTLQRVKEFLGEELYKEHIIINESLQTGEKYLSRRKMFEFMFKKTQVKVGAILLEDRSIKLDGMIYRKLLANRLKNAERLNIKQRKFGWYTPTFGKKCWGCGICQKVCPQKAIHISEEEGDVRIMKHILWKCDTCEVCKIVCMEQAIEEMKILYTDNPFIPAVTKIQSRTCKQCGAPVKLEDEQELCRACYNKNKRMANSRK